MMLKDVKKRCNNEEEIFKYNPLYTWGNISSVLPVQCQGWGKRHTEEYLFFVILVRVVAIILAIVFLVLGLIKKQNLKNVFTIFLFVIGLIVCVVASNIACCTGS